MEPRDLLDAGAMRVSVPSVAEFAVSERVMTAKLGRR